MNLKRFGKANYVIFKHYTRQEGVALIMTVFVVALLSAIVLNLTFTTYLSSTVNSSIEKSVQAEYLLKSALNLARVLVYEDQSTDVDAPKDVWAKFTQGKEIPLSEFGINIPNLRMVLEIQAEEAKLPLRGILTGDSASARVDKKWRDAIARFFHLLGFDDDSEEDHTGLFKGRVFSSKELVSMLIDYMDRDNDSYSGTDNFPDGFESALDPDVFPNQRIKRIGEIQTIPGFTPNRFRKILPFVTVFRNNRVNINLAYPIVLKSLHEDIGDPEIAVIREIANSDMPFTGQNLRSEMTSIIGESSYNEISTMLTTTSRWFQVSAKVDYGLSVYFIRAYISRAFSSSFLPRIRSVEIF